MAKRKRRDDDGPHESGSDSEGSSTKGPERKTTRVLKKKDVTVRARPQQHPGNLVKAAARRHLAQAPVSARDGKSPAEIAADDVDSGKLKKFKDLISKVEINRWRTPHPPPKEGASASAAPVRTDQKSFFDLLNEPVHQGRNFRAKVDKIKAARRHYFWCFGVEDGTQYRWVCYGDARMANLDDATVALIGNDVAALVNRYPGTLDQISKTFNPPNQGKLDFPRKTFLSLGYDRHAGIERTYLTPSIQKDWNMTGYVSLIDPSTYSHYNLTFAIAISTIDKANIPDLSTARFVGPDGTKLSHANADGSIRHKSVVPDDKSKAAELREAEKVARALKFVMEGKVIAKKEAKKLVDFYTEQWGKQQPARHHFKIYGGKDALVYLRLSPSSHALQIIPSTAVSRDTKTTFPMFTLRTVDRARAIPILDQGIDTFLRTGNVRDAWLTMAEQVVIVEAKIRAGVPSNNQCNCVYNETLVRLHHCGSCGRPTLCSSMSLSFLGLRICPLCKNKETKGGAGPAEDTMIRLIKARHRCECKHRRLDYKSSAAQRILEEAKTDVKARFTAPSAKWTDGFRQMEEILKVDRDGVDYQHNPRQMSLDAVFSYSPALGGKLYAKHCSGNLESTALALNFAKHIHLPAWLDALQRYRKIANAYGEGTVSFNDLLVAQKQLLNVSTSMRKLALKAKLQRRVRDKQPFNKTRYALDKEEWISGKRRDTPGPWDEPRYVSNLRAYEHGVWTRNTIARMKTLIIEIEEEFQVTLPRGRDGCPWFGFEEYMPVGWSWTLCERIVNYHYHTMHELCNGLDPTPDTPETIFVEIIHTGCIIKCEVLEDGKFYTKQQKRDMKQEYGEFLDLPMVADMNDPLVFSLAHKLHGRMMWSGWKNAPTTLADRCNADNNLLIETRTSNYLKSNFEGDCYAQLEQMLQEIKLPEKWFDPDLEVHAVPRQLEDDFAGLKREEDIDFEEELANPEALGSLDEDEELDEVLLYGDEEDSDDENDSDEDDSDEDDDGDDESGDMPMKPLSTSKIRVPPLAEGLGLQPTPGPQPALSEEDSLMTEYNNLLDHVAEENPAITADSAFLRDLRDLKRAARDGDRPEYMQLRGELAEKWEV